MCSHTAFPEKSLFSHVIGQPKVREFFKRAFEQDMVSHAYLFLGAPGAGKTQCAHAVAQAILCENSTTACGECDSCRRVERGSHPDVHWYAPDGVSGYLVGQIRDLIADVSLAPIRSDKKVYIIQHADLLYSASANALLKTLEEPPENVTFILIGRSRETILSTIVSRCQVVPFRTLPEEELVGVLVSETGVSKQVARRAFGATGFSIANAREFLLSKERQHIRYHMIDVLGRIADADDLDILKFAKELIFEVKAPLDDVKSAQKAMLEENAEFLSKGALKELEDRHKRELTARERGAIQELLMISRSYLRDVLMVLEGADTLLVNDDFDGAIRHTASRSTPAAVLKALAAVDDASERLSRNVTPQLALEVMLFDMREVL